MLFNSLEFIFIFLPIVLFGYFALNKNNLFYFSKIFLVLSSLVFYSWWNVAYLPIILVSMLMNYTLGAEFCKIVVHITTLFFLQFDRFQRSRRLGSAIHLQWRLSA
jgi:alginate O-acetyltransferase complex protein AlgI